MRHSFIFALTNRDLIIVVDEEGDDRLELAHAFFREKTVVVFIAHDRKSFSYRVDNGPLVQINGSFLTTLFQIKAFDNLNCRIKIARLHTVLAGFAHEAFKAGLNDFSWFNTLKQHHGKVIISNHPHNRPNNDSYLNVTTFKYLLLTDFNMLIRYFLLFDIYGEPDLSLVWFLNCREFWFEVEYA